MANIADLNIELLPVMFGILSVIVMIGLFRLMKNSVNRMTRVYTIAFALGFIGLMFLSPAAGAVAAVEIETPVLNFDGLPSTLEFTGLTASTVYQLKFDGTNETQFTTGAGQTEYTLYIIIDKATDGTLNISVCTFASSTVLASVEVQTPEADQFVPLNTIITIATVAIILGFLTYFVGQIKSGKGMR